MPVLIRFVSFESRYSISDPISMIVPRVKQDPNNSLSAS